MCTKICIFSDSCNRSIYFVTVSHLFFLFLLNQFTFTCCAKNSFFLRQSFTFAHRLVFVCSFVAQKFIHKTVSTHLFVIMQQKLFRMLFFSLWKSDLLVTLPQFSYRSFIHSLCELFHFIMLNYFSNDHQTVNRYRSQKWFTFFSTTRKAKREKVRESEG